MRTETCTGARRSAFGARGSSRRLWRADGEHRHSSLYVSSAARRPFEGLRVAPSTVERRAPRAARRSRQGALALLCTLALAAGGSGCGYALAGRGSFLPAYIRTIGLPPFVNHTQVFEIERPITERVRQELIGRGSYTVTPETTGVDAVLTGEISSITVAPAAFTDQQQASRYVLIMTSKVEFKDLKTGKVLWSNPAMQFREEYEISTTTTPDPTTFLGQDANAIERIASEFARSLVSSILEAF